VRYIRFLVIALNMTLAVFFADHSALASDYPDRSITLISPYAPGGLTDVLTRLIAKRLSERLGQAVIVNNRTGGGGIIGMETAAKSPPDGYTIVMVSQGLASVNASLYKNLPYDTLRDFVPITLIASFPMVLVGNSAAPPKTVSDFVAAARANPGSLAYGSAGNASTAHLAMELLSHQIGIQVNHIPYRGEAPAFSDLIGGNLSVMFATLGGAMPLIESGKFRPIAIATKSRSTLLPNVPTLMEQGVPNFEVTGWYGLLVPKKTPKIIIDRLSSELMAMAREPEFREQLFARGLEVVGSTPEVLAKMVESETERWRDVVLKAGIKVD